MAPELSSALPPHASQAAGGRHWRLPAAGWLLLVLSAWLPPLLVFLYRQPYLIDYDAYFHVQLAAALRERGLWLQTFPWATESIWCDGWFDKEWLFHVLLASLLSLGRIAAAKLLVVLGNLLVILGLWTCCRALRLSARATAFWLILLPWCAWGIFWVRLVVCRPQVFSIALLFLALAAMLRRQHLWLGLLSLLYAWLYTGHWQLLGLVALYDVAHAFLDEDGRRRPVVDTCWPLLLAAATGMLLGEVLHPHFPRNLYGLFVQNVLVLADAWVREPASFRPAELQPAGWQILRLAGPICFGLALAALHVLRGRARLSRDILLFACYSLGYLVLAVKSFRFLEYFVPVAVVFLAVFFARHPLPRRLRERPFCVAALGLLVLGVGALANYGEMNLFAVLLPVLVLLFIVGAWPGLRLRLNPLVPAFGLAFVAYAGLGYREYYVRYNIQQAAKSGGQVSHAAVGVWLNENLPPGAVVFSTDWAANAILWYHAPDLRYLVFLDPLFMRQHSPERFDLWDQIRRGQHPDPTTAIRDRFGAAVVFLTTADTTLEGQLVAAGAQPVSAGPAGEKVYRLPAAPLPAPQ
jgi:hypothetical protein